MEIIDNAFDSRLVAKAARSFPAEAWDGWARYNSPFERKLASRELTDPCRRLIEQMQELRGDLHSDESLHGGGMHAMGAGGWLDLHLDCDRHPQTGRQRRRNAILFLNPAWPADWGGALEFWNSERCIDRVWPQFNRLVLFDTADGLTHGIPDAIRCPPGTLRMSLATYFWGDVIAEATRPRALFLPRPGEVWNEHKHQLAQHRAGLSQLTEASAAL